MHVPEAHHALIAKTDAFDEAVRARRKDDMKCAPGCTACCVVQLTVSEVEAALLEEGIARLGPEARERLRRRGEASEATSPCAFLDEAGRCAVYASRPLVCRTQGLPMRYDEGLSEAQTFGRSDANEALTWCPLNFSLRAPRSEDVLDASRLNLMIALSNRGAGGDATRRVSLTELARGTSSATLSKV